MQKVARLTKQAIADFTPYKLENITMPGTTLDGFYDLTLESDFFILVPGLLTESPQGMRGLDGDDFILGSLDSEIINGNKGLDLIFGGGGNDYLRGGQDDDDIYGEEGDDILNGNFGVDFVDGGVGNDIVRGGRDDDLLVGGVGDDTLIGDVGIDGLAGNEGSDLFVLRTEIATFFENDLILDFNKLEDRIGLTGGITEADLLLEEVVLDLNLVSFPEEFGSVEEVVRSFEEFTGVNIDPDGDRLINSTYISKGGNILAIGLNVSEADLRGRFVSISDADIAIG